MLIESILAWKELTSSSVAVDKLLGMGGNNFNNLVWLRTCALPVVKISNEKITVRVDTKDLIIQNNGYINIQTVTNAKRIKHAKYMNLIRSSKLIILSIKRAGNNTGSFNSKFINKVDVTDLLFRDIL